MNAELGNKLTPEIIISLLPVIERTVQEYLEDFALSLRDCVRDELIDKLSSLEFPDKATGKVKSRAITITKNKCRDMIRAAKRRGPMMWEGEIRKPRGRCETCGRPVSHCVCLNEPANTAKRPGPYQKGSRPRFREVKAALGRRTKTIRNMELYQAWCNGMSRRRIAKKFGLTEGQVRGRLASTRKKIIITLANIKTSK